MFYLIENYYLIEKYSYSHAIPLGPSWDRIVLLRVWKHCLDKMYFQNSEVISYKILHECIYLVMHF